MLNPDLLTLTRAQDGSQSAYASVFRFSHLIWAANPPPPTPDRPGSGSLWSDDGSGGADLYTQVFTLVLLFSVVSDHLAVGPAVVTDCWTGDVK